MKLLYHRTDASGGLIILESEPQYRTIFSNSNASNVKRIPFPFVNFIIRYEINELGFYWRGIHGGGLRVYGSKESLKSSNDIAFVLPNETSRYGLVCSTHTLDYKSYKSLIDLVNMAVSNWWGLDNHIDYNPIPYKPWHHTKPEELKNAQWQYNDSLKNLAKQAIENAEHYILTNEIKDSGILDLIGDEIFTNEIWPPR